MKVLTFGWDYPPRKNGGLGVASFGLTKALIESGVYVTFVLPKTQPVIGPGQFIFADIERFSDLETGVQTSTYASSHGSVKIIDERGVSTGASRSLLEEVHRYAHKASQIAKQEDFDLIHAHDWSAYLAGVAAKVATGKPLILHVHATSFDQAGGDNVDPSVYKIELEAFKSADKIVAISQLVKDTIITKHRISSEKIEVIHNEHDYGERRHRPTLQGLKAEGKKIVLYHGRITIQKGVDYLVAAARKVVDTDPDVVFVISGWGDMTNQIINQVGATGLSKHVIFAGALWDDERDQMYQAADLVVMPSVSEPFGLVPLEALQNGTPALISKQSGVREVLKNILVVDFWDVDEMANKIVSALCYPVMRNQMVKEGRFELLKMSWRRAASKVRTLYERLIQLVTT